jgi:Zn-dependent M28 family amino/carboxypeptidase
MRNYLLALSVLVLPAATPPTLSEDALRAHLALLSSDLFEGRGTGQRGGDLTVAYLESQCGALGLKPVKGNSFRQAVQIAGMLAQPNPGGLRIEAGGQPLGLVHAEDWVFAPGDAMPLHSFDADLLFVGYGISAPEEGWDDYKGVDCRGKVLVMLVNDPQPTAEAPDRFGGKSLTYYGRWTYKFEEAHRRGAAGALLIHTDASASYGWSVIRNGWTAEQFRLAEGAPETPFQGWITDGAAGRLFKASGQELAVLRAAAERQDFRPAPLSARLKGDMHSRIRKIPQYNVAGLVPGTDPRLKEEVVIYSAHWDHLGKIEGPGDTIFNGAVDNGSGVAALLAMAQAAVQSPAKRSQLFLWVCAEEQGLLGSSAYVADPLWPLARTAANLNLDSLNWVGATRDVAVGGSERTDLVDFSARVAAGMGLALSKAAPDLRGSYFRSDHFSFAKVGVPAFSIRGGREYFQDQGGSAAKDEHFKGKYHQVTDEYDSAWDLSGMAQQAQFTLNLGRAVADAPKMPAWKAGDPFGKARAR